MIDADGPCFAVQTVGTVGGTTPSITGKIQESADNSTWTDVANAAFTAVTASNNVQAITFERTKRVPAPLPDACPGPARRSPCAVLIGEQKKTV